MSAPAATLDATATAARERALAYGGLAFASVGWAAAFILGKVAMAELSPLTASSLRYAIAATTLLPFAARAWSRSASPLRRIALPLAAMALLGGVLYQWAFLAALARTSATNASLLVALNPVVSVLLAPLVGERLTRVRLAGTALAFAGAATVISRGDAGALLALRLDTGDLIALGAAGCWALFNLASRPVSGRIAPSLANLIVYGTGGLAQLALAQGEHPVAQIASASPAALGAVVAMALWSSVLGGQCFLAGMRVLGIARTVTFIYLVPVQTALLAGVFLGERVSPAQMLGGAAVLLGVVVVSRAR